MEYVLMAGTVILIILALILLLDRKNRKATLRPEPPHPFRRIPGPENRGKVALQAAQLLDKWNLSLEDQNILLGLPSEDPSTLKAYREGQDPGEDVDRLGRMGHLLAIDESLSLIFKESPDRRYRWVTLANANFDGNPLDLMKQGYEGILAVRRYLSFERGM